MPGVIDGYNLLRAVQNMQEQSSMLEIDLCAILCEYLRRINDWAVIVFDGVGPPDKSGLRGTERLEVVFSGLKQEADDTIEDLIKENSAPRRLFVVSSDRRIVSAAKKRKCVPVKAVEFWGMICQVVERQLPVPEPKEKRQGIGSRQTEQWMIEFGLEKKTDE